MDQRGMRWWRWEYLTHLQEGAAGGGWLAGDGDDGWVTAGGGQWRQHSAWGGWLTGDSDSDGRCMTAMAGGVDSGSIGNI